QPVPQIGVLVTLRVERAEEDDGRHQRRSCTGFQAGLESLFLLSVSVSSSLRSAAMVMIAPSRENAIFLPSGDQAGSMSPRPLLVSCCSPLPSTPIAKIENRLPRASLEKASRVLSGAQVGPLLDFVSDVIAWLSEPSGRTSQISRTVAPTSRRTRL